MQYDKINTKKHKLGERVLYVGQKKIHIRKTEIKQYGSENKQVLCYARCGADITSLAAF